MLTTTLKTFHHGAYGPQRLRRGRKLDRDELERMVRRSSLASEGRRGGAPRPPESRYYKHKETEQYHVSGIQGSRPAARTATRWRL